MNTQPNLPLKEIWSSLWKAAPFKMTTICCASIIIVLFMIQFAIATVRMYQYKPVHFFWIQVPDTVQKIVEKVIYKDSIIYIDTNHKTPVSKYDTHIDNAEKVQIGS